MRDVGDSHLDCTLVWFRWLFLYMVCDDLYFAIIEKLKERFPILQYVSTRLEPSQIMHANICNVTILFFNNNVAVRCDCGTHIENTFIAYCKPTFLEDLEYEIERRLF